jgi:enterochelin esterase-like enzyme
LRALIAMFALLKPLLGCLVCLLVSCAALAGEIASETFRSDTLGRDYKYTVYLPDAYLADKSQRRFPVLFLLHGANGDENEWVQKGGVRETLDALIGRRAIRPMVVVMPGHTQGWWVDGAKEKAETALLEDLMPQAAGKYRIETERKGRLIAGLSAGGGGVVNIIFKHPTMFAAAAALSPSVYDPLPPNNSSAVQHPPFQKEGKFDAETWKALNYPTWIEGYKQSGTIVPLYINSGDHDRFGIVVHAAVLYQRLLAHQPQAVAYRVVDGDHEWMVWRDTLGDALVFMDRYLGP